MTGSADDKFTRGEEEEEEHEEEEVRFTRKTTGGAPIRAMAVDSFLRFPPL